MAGVINGTPGPGWLPDPIAATRRRYWDGGTWTARVSAPETHPVTGASTDRDGISWRSGLDTLALPEVEPPVSPPMPVVVTHTRRRLVPLVAAAALVAIAAAAVAGAAVLRDGNQRPEVAPEISSRDTSAGFALRYPDDWQVQLREPGEGIRFTIAAPGAPTTETNTVSVAVGPTSAALPELHTLADQLTERLRTELGNVELGSASQSRLAGAPALHFVFRDPQTSPATVIEQYVGRTTAGRPLTITITVREPRTAPSAAVLRDVVASVSPA